MNNRFGFLKLLVIGFVAVLFLVGGYFLLRGGFLRSGSDVLSSVSFDIQQGKDGYIKVINSDLREELGTVTKEALADAESFGGDVSRLEVYFAGNPGVWVVPGKNKFLLAYYFGVGKGIHPTLAVADFDGGNIKLLGELKETGSWQGEGKVSPNGRYFAYLESSTSSYDEAVCQLKLNELRVFNLEDGNVVDVFDPGDRRFGLEDGDFLRTIEYNWNDNSDLKVHYERFHCVDESEKVLYDWTHIFDSKKGVLLLPDY